MQVVIEERFLGDGCLGEADRDEGFEDGAFSNVLAQLSEKRRGCGDGRDKLSTCADRERGLVFSKFITPCCFVRGETLVEVDLE